MDGPAFFALMDASGYPGWTAEIFAEWLGKLLPDGFFLAFERRSGALAASAMACHNPSTVHPFGGTLSCVAVHPDHRGRRLGHVLSALATDRLIRAGYRDIYMQTDDWRLPALKIYLRMGWVPFIVNDDVLPRWRSVCEALDLAYAPGDWPRA